MYGGVLNSRKKTTQTEEKQTNKQTDKKRTNKQYGDSLGRNVKIQTSTPTLT